jgi:transposase
MKTHANAALSLNARRRMVRRVLEQGWSVTKAATAAEVSDRTCSKWVARYRAEGEAGLLDRNSAPKSIPHRPIGCRRSRRCAGVRMTAAQIAEVLGMALSTVSAVLLRIGLGKLSRLEPFEPANRYQRDRPGELIHIDIKSSARAATVPAIATRKPPPPSDSFAAASRSTPHTASRSSA